MRRTSWRSRAARRIAGDEGSAIIEFCVLAVLMLVPVVYLVLTLGRLQGAAFAAQGAAREAARAFVTAGDEGAATERADAAALIAFADLVTEMREVKHPYHTGIKAQKGIEF